MGEPAGFQARFTYAAKLLNDGARIPP